MLVSIHEGNSCATLAPGVNFLSHRPGERQSEIQG